MITINTSINDITCICILGFIRHSGRLIIINVDLNKTIINLKYYTRIKAHKLWIKLGLRSLCGAWLGCCLIFHSLAKPKPVLSSIRRTRVLNLLPFIPAHKNLEPISNCYYYCYIINVSYSYVCMYIYRNNRIITRHLFNYLVIGRERGRSGGYKSAQKRYTF